MGNPFNVSNNGQNQVNLGAIAGTINRFKKQGFNDNQILNYLMMSNPQLANVVKQIQASGLTPHEYALKNFNVDIDPMLAELIRGINQ